MAAQTVTYKGKLSMLGNSRQDRGGTVYSVIEIGNDTIEDVHCLDKLDNYLNRALDHSGEVELEIDPKPTKSDVLKLFFGPKAIITYVVITTILMMVSNFFVVVILAIALGFIIFGTLKAPRYAVVDAISIDGKRYAN